MITVILIGWVGLDRHLAGCVAGTFLISWQREESAAGGGWWHALFPLTAAGITGLVQPVVRAGLKSTDYPLFFTGLVGATSLLFSLGVLPLIKRFQRPIWSVSGVKGLIVAALLENLGFVLICHGIWPCSRCDRFAADRTSPLWVVLAGLFIFRRRLSWQTVAGSLLTVAGTVAITSG